MVRDGDPPAGPVRQDRWPRSRAARPRMGFMSAALPRTKRLKAVSSAASDGMRRGITIQRIQRSDRTFMWTFAREHSDGGLIRPVDLTVDGFQRIQVRVTNVPRLKQKHSRGGNSAHA